MNGAWELWWDKHISVKHISVKSQYGFSKLLDHIGSPKNETLEIL